MEGNRAAAVALCCMISLLSDATGSSTQSAGRTYLGSSACMDDCSPNKNKVVACDCATFCQLAICGTASNGAADVASCVDGCTKNRNLYTKFL
uniref:Acidic protein n=1 Tax=Oryza rufipogon TaxID=4529 RepID=A0A0E0N8X8_ORYRU